MPAPIYQDALYNLIPIGNNEYISIITWIMRQIGASKYGFIKLKASDLKNALGPDFLEKKDSTIYESIRHVMKKYKIKVRKKEENGNLIIILENLVKRNDILENKIEIKKEISIEIIDKEDTMFCR